jgi:hypothetical protein
MTFPATRLVTTIFGRRLGLTPLSSAQTGSGRARGETIDLLVGPEALQNNVSAGTTALNLPAYGVSNISGTSAASSSVYTLDPPIPGVPVWLNFNSSANAPAYVKTANGETIVSSQGTTFSVIKSTNGAANGLLGLMGITTAVWSAIAGVSTATFALSTTT